MNNVDSHSAMGNGRPTVPQSAQRNAIAKLKKAPECPSLEARNWLIHLHYSRKEFRVCKILIDEELQKSSGKSEYVNYVKGILLRHEGKIQESLENFQISHSLNPTNVDNVKQVARSLYLLGKHRLSQEAYHEAERTSEQPSWDVYHNLGLCSLHVGDNNNAKEYLRKAIQSSRQECSFVALAKIHVKENDVGGAIRIYSDASETYPDSADVATALGILYMRAGRYQQAFERLGSALVHDPTCSRALLAVGSMMQDHQDFDVALSKYKIASRHLPESTSLWNNIGMCFFAKKKYVAAISCLKRANYLSPFDWKTLYNLGLVHVTTQQYASAFHFLSAAINLRSDSGPTFMLLAVALRHLGDVDNTKQAFSQASKLSPEELSVPLNYAVFLHSMKDYESALEQLARFQELAEQSTAVDKEMVATANRLHNLISSSGSESSSNRADSEVVRADSGKVAASNERSDAAGEVDQASQPATEEQTDMAPDEV